MQIEVQPPLRLKLTLMGLKVLKKCKIYPGMFYFNFFKTNNIHVIIFMISIVMAGCKENVSHKFETKIKKVELENIENDFNLYFEYMKDGLFDSLYLTFIGDPTDSNFSSWVSHERYEFNASLKFVDYKINAGFTDSLSKKYLDVSITRYLHPKFSYENKEDWYLDTARIYIEVIDYKKRHSFGKFIPWAKPYLATP